MLKDIKNSEPRPGAERVFIKIGDSAIPGWLKALEDGDPLVRRNAALNLWEMKNALAVPALVEALKDEDLNLRQISAQAIGSTG